MAKTNWRQLEGYDKNYLGSQHLLNEDGSYKEIVATIDKVEAEKIKDNQGRAEDKWVIHFKENWKPLIANKTNMKMIEKVLGSSFIEDWKNKQIVIGVEQIKAFGETRHAIRVKQKLPPKQNTTKLVCENCKKPIEDHAGVPAEIIVNAYKDKFGKNLCFNCGTKVMQAQKGAN